MRTGSEQRKLGEGWGVGQDGSCSMRCEGQVHSRDDGIHRVEEQTDFGK